MRPATHVRVEGAVDKQAFARPLQHDMRRTSMPAFGFTRFLCLVALLASLLLAGPARAQVNSPPVNSVPATQQVVQNGVLVFSTGLGNRISISDPDAAGGALRVTLTANSGVLNLGSSAGLSFLVGSGSGDATMTFEGTLADINNALDGLVFAPTPGYAGVALLQITTNDMGNTGTGGPQADTDVVLIRVLSPIPAVLSVGASSPDGSYTVGQSISLTIQFDQAVFVDASGGSPTLRLETGLIDRLATYVGGSGSDVLVFQYTVQPGDVSADLDYASTTALALNGARLQGAAAVDAVLTLPTVGGPNSLAGQRNLVVNGVASGGGVQSVPTLGPVGLLLLALLMAAAMAAVQRVARRR